MRFWSGFAAGAAVITAVVHAFLIVAVLPGIRTELTELSRNSIVMTALVTNTTWSWGVPCAVFLAVVFIAGVARDEKLRVGALGTLALIAIAAMVLTVWLAYRPFFEFAPGGFEAP